MGCCFSKGDKKGGQSSFKPVNPPNFERSNLYEEIKSNKSYIFSIMQCLSYTKGLTKYFLKKYDYYNNSNNQISNDYYNLLNNLWKEKNLSYPYSPYNFSLSVNISKSLFNNNQLYSGKDLLNYFFENIHNELNAKNNNKGNNLQNKHTLIQLNKQLSLQNFLNYFKNNFNSIISNLFYGTYEIIFKCIDCEKTNYKYEIFKFLEFSLNEIDSFFGIKPIKEKERGLRFINNVKIIDLYKCFEYNDKDKSLTTKKYECINCNNHQFFNFSSKIYSMPNYLIIILNNEKGSLYKVNYPIILDIGKYITHCEIASKFNLYAVIGKNNNEDYFSYCRDLTNNYKWYKYDNNNEVEAKQCQEKEYLDVVPSFLFYEVSNE